MKKLKYLLFLFTFLLITDVNGLQLGRPETFTYFSDGTEVSGNASSIGYWGTDNYWQGASKIGSFTPTSSNAYGIQFYWNGANLCQDKDISISGTIVGWSDFFDQQAYHVDLIMNNQPLTCSFTKENSSRIKYTCYGKGGGSYSIFFTQDSFYGSYLNYDISVSKNIELSCDVSNEAIVNQSITNTQDIINNQNQNTQDIINNNSGNTQDIIDNQNQNKQDIIDNQNQNTDKEIESQQVCNKYDNNSVIVNGYLESSGYIQNSSYFGITDYIKINDKDTIKVITAPDNYVQPYICFYNVNKTLISCIQEVTLSLNDIITIPSNSDYVRFSIRIPNNKPQFEVCTNGNQALNDSVNGLNDNITNSNTDNPSSSFSDFQNMLPENGVITQLITLPISLFQKILTSLNASCSNFNLGSLYNHELILPCINVSNYVGSTLWNVIDVLFSGFFVLVIAKKMIATFESFSSMKEGDILD